MIKISLSIAGMSQGIINSEKKNCKGGIPVEYTSIRISNINIRVFTYRSSSPETSS
jgi:hypothetical protein